MNCVLVAGAVVAGVSTFALERRRALRRSARLRFPICFVAALLLATAMLFLIPAGLGRDDSSRIWITARRPLFLLGLALWALGLALPCAIERPTRKRTWQPLSGKTLLGMIILSVVVIVLFLYRLYEAGSLLLLVILGGCASLVIVFGFLPFVRRVKATWSVRSEVRLTPFLISGCICYAGLSMMFASEFREILAVLNVFEGVRAGSSGYVAMYASSIHGSGLIVSNRDATSIAGLDEEFGRRLYTDWSREDPYLYLCRPVGPTDADTGELWRYGPRDGSLVCLQEIPDGPFRVSPDSCKVAFARCTDRKRGSEAELICGATDHDRNDHVLCEGGRSDWLAACCWGPLSGKLYFAISRMSSSGREPGLWSVYCSGDEPGEPVLVLPRKAVSEVSCNALETHLAIFGSVGAKDSWRARVEVVELATLKVKELPLDGRVLNVPWEDELVWDAEGQRLAFGDVRTLNVYNIRTESVYRLLEARVSTAPFSHEGYDRFMPVTWLPDGKLLFLMNCDSFRTYDFESGRVKNSPLTKRIRKWLKKH